MYNSKMAQRGQNWPFECPRFYPNNALAALCAFARMLSTCSSRLRICARASRNSVVSWAFSSRSAAEDGEEGDCSATQLAGQAMKIITDTYAVGSNRWADIHGRRWRDWCRCRSRSRRRRRCRLRSGNRSRNRCSFDRSSHRGWARRRRARCSRGRCPREDDTGIQIDKFACGRFAREELSCGKRRFCGWRGWEYVGLERVCLGMIVVLMNRQVFHGKIELIHTLRGTTNAIGSMQVPATLYARAISQSETLSARRGRKHIPRCESPDLCSARACKESDSHS